MGWRWQGILRGCIGGGPWEGERGREGGGKEARMTLEGQGFGRHRGEGEFFKQACVDKETTPCTIRCQHGKTSWKMLVYKIPCGVLQDSIPQTCWTPDKNLEDCML